jgi:hypothetical protein
MISLDSPSDAIAELIRPPAEQEPPTAQKVFEIALVPDLIIAHIHDQTALKRMSCVSKDCLSAVIRGL